MAISALGSGIDIPKLVKDLVANEREPVANRINNQGNQATTQLSALGSIKSSLSTLQGALESLKKVADNPALKTTVPDKAGFTASIAPNAVTGVTGATTAATGNYSVEVLSLAQSQKLASSAFTDGIITANGTLDISWGDESLKVEIQPGSSLSTIASAINAAAKGKGVTATVVTSNEGQHLVFNAIKPGTDGALKVSTSGGDGGLQALTWDGSGGGLRQTVPASDALVKVDGFERRSSSNTIEDIVSGVSLTVTKAEPGTTQTLTVAQDTGGLKTALQTFITAYNGSVSVLKTTSAYNNETKKGAVLTGDAMVRGLQSQLRAQVSGNLTDLREIGVNINKDGTLSLDGAKFDKTMAANADAASRVLGKDSPLGEELTALLKSNVDTTGALSLRTESLSKTLKKLEKELDDLGLRMKRVSDRYTAQFTAMEKLVVQMQGTSNSLSKSLASLPGASSRS